MKGSWLFRRCFFSCGSGKGVCGRGVPDRKTGLKGALESRMGEFQESKPSVSPPSSEREVLALSPHLPQYLGVLPSRTLILWKFWSFSFEVCLFRIWNSYFLISQSQNLRLRESQRGQES